MRRVILTFLLTSLFWWGLFTYYAYKKSGQEVSMTDELVGWLTDAVEQTGESDAIVESVEMEDDDSTTDVSAVKMQKKPVEAKSKSSSTNKAKPKQTENVAKKDIAPQPVASASQQLDALSQEIVGKWQPVEGAKCPLEITKYGVVIKTEYSLKIRRKSSLNGDELKIGYERCRIKLIKEGGAVYLEIYNSDEYSGRYKRISQPRKINASPIDLSEYPTAIVGKWTPIEGQDCPLEITRYGTAIKTEYSLDRRSEYTLTGDKLKIRYDNATVVLSEDANYRYLEIFNSEDFSGRYRKTK